MANLIPVYKNELRRRYRHHEKIRELQELVTQLQTDHAAGIAEIRHSLVGHSLHLCPKRIGKGWLFLKKSSFEIVSADLSKIDEILSLVDGQNYYGADRAPPIPVELRSCWRDPNLLGDPQMVRSAQIYAGIWSPGVTGIVPGNTTTQDAGLRVASLMTYLLQVHRMTVPIPFNFKPEVFHRLLHELLVSDFVVLVETVYTGPPLNRYGPTTTSMLEEWRLAFPNHQGIQELEDFREKIPVEFSTWKNEVRNKIIAHVRVVRVSDGNPVDSARIF